MKTLSILSKITSEDSEINILETSKKTKQLEPIYGIKSQIEFIKEIILDSINLN